MPNFAALRAAVFSIICEKPPGGEYRPPDGARVNLRPEGGVRTSLPFFPDWLYIFSAHVKISDPGHLNRAPTGGSDIRPPRRVFVDNGKIAARSASKFVMTISSSFLHIMCNF